MIKLYLIIYFYSVSLINSPIYIYFREEFYFILSPPMSRHLVKKKIIKPFASREMSVRTSICPLIPKPSQTFPDCYRFVHLCTTLYTHCPYMHPFNYSLEQGLSEANLIWTHLCSSIIPADVVLGQWKWFHSVSYSHAAAEILHSTLLLMCGCWWTMSSTISICIELNYFLCLLTVTSWQQICERYP